MTDDFIRSLSVRLDEVERREHVRTGIYASVYRSTNQTITTATATAISFDTVVDDTDTMWVIGSPTRLTINTAGRYIIFGNIEFEANGTGDRKVIIRLNGSTIIASLHIDATAPTHTEDIPIETMWTFAVGDYIELVVTHTRGANLNVLTSARYSADFRITRIA